MTRRNLGLVLGIAGAVAAVAIYLVARSSSETAETEPDRAALTDPAGTGSGSTLTRPPRRVEAVPAPAPGSVDPTTPTAPELHPEEVAQARQNALAIGAARGSGAPGAGANVPAIKSRATIGATYDAADQQRALEVLKTSPGDLPALRVMARAACESGDQAAAKRYLTALPVDERAALGRECAASGRRGSGSGDPTFTAAGRNPRPPVPEKTPRTPSTP